MRLAIYLFAVGALGAVAWHYPYLFELPLAAALGGAYWLIAPTINAGDDSEGNDQA